MRSHTMVQGICSMNCLDIWTEENNDIIKKWKRNERSQEMQHDTRKRYYSEIHKLLQKIQGVPCVPASARLELTVLYNTLLFALNLSEFAESRVLLEQGLVRALEAQGFQLPSSELVVLWHAALRSFTGTDHLSCLQQLLCVQWALSLCIDQLEELEELLSDPQQEVAAASGDLLAVIGDLRFPIEGNPALSVAMAPGELKELLHICTVTTKGVREMEEGKDSEALVAFRQALSLPAPRTLLAQLHTLAGICLAKLGRPQSALQCFRKALEVDFGCRSALYQSSLLYSQLGNGQAQMEALSLLHTAVAQLVCGDTSRDNTPLLSPKSLLHSPALTRILATPSPPGVQHALAHRCLQSHRVPEAVEHYLDLLTTLQADGKLLVNASGSSSLPRIPEIYLEAAFAMLKARRYWDAVAICEEVLSKTVGLVPERLVLEVSVEEHQSPDFTTEQPDPLCGRNKESVEERLNLVLWAGASYLLQGQAYSHIKDNTAAVTNFTRSINVLLKVLVKNKDGQCRDPGDGEEAGVKLQTLQWLKGVALAGRGVCFLDTGKHREALQDFQLSLQASPGMEHAELWLMEALWQLGREEEAVSHWRRNPSSTQTPAPLESTPGALPLYLQHNLQNGISVEPEGLKKKMEDLHSRRAPTGEDG